MKKQRTFSAAMLVLFLLTGLQYSCVSMRVKADSHNNTANQSTLDKKIIGTWQLCKKDSTVNHNLYNKGFIRYKIISDVSFINVDIKERERSNYNTIYGSYEIKDGVYTEFVETTSSGFKHVLGQRNPYKIRIVGDLIFFDGLNKNDNEIWKRLE